MKNKIIFLGVLMCAAAAFGQPTNLPSGGTTTIGIDTNGYVKAPAGGVVFNTTLNKKDFYGGPLGAPVDLIIDTDLGSDIDDAYDLALAHALQDNGELNILAMGFVGDGIFGAPAIEAINWYYGHGNI